MIFFSQIMDVVEAELSEHALYAWRNPHCVDVVEKLLVTNSPLPLLLPLPDPSTLPGLNEYLFYRGWRGYGYSACFRTWMEIDLLNHYDVYRYPTLQLWPVNAEEALISKYQQTKAVPRNRGWWRVADVLFFLFALWLFYWVLVEDPQGNTPSH